MVMFENFIIFLLKESKKKKVGNVFAISTRAAQRLGYSDFSEGSPGKEKRSEIAEAIKEKEGISKIQMPKPIKTGKLKTFAQAMEDLRKPGAVGIVGASKRKEGIQKEAQKTLYNVLSNRKYPAPDTLSSASITTGVTSPQLRVE